jgi:hypothetical protein
MRNHVGVLRQRATATTKLQRKAFAAFRRGHVIDFRQSHRDNTKGSLDLKDRIQIRRKGSF